MVDQNKATMRKKLRSAFANKSVADTFLDVLVESQQKWNATLDKLNADAAGATPAVAATATLNLTADIILTSVATGAARNTNTLTLQVLAAAANPTDTILADFTGTAAAIILTITPNDGTNNAATPVDLTTAELVELINSGVVVGKTVTVTDASSRRILQTATGGDATALADAGEGDGVVGTFSGGVTAIAGLDVNYVSSGAITTLFQADEDKAGDQYKSTMRKVIQSALAHRKLANELLDSMEEIQVAYNALLTKLDAEAGTLNDANYVSTLAVTPIDADGIGSAAQHKATLRKSLRSALAHAALADSIIDAISDIQNSFNDALALIDAGTINGAMAVLKVVVLTPDVEG